MKYDVISAFIDRRNGRQIDPGETVPDGLDRETTQRLVAANCLRQHEPETPASAPNSDSADASDLFFGDASDGEAGDPRTTEGNAAGVEAPPADATGAAGGSAPRSRRARRPAAAGVTS